MMRGTEPKIVIITRPTQLQGLVAQHATPQQAKFKMVRAKVAASAAPAPMRASSQVLAEMAAQDDLVAEAAASDFDDLEEQDVEYSSTIADLRTRLARF